MKKYIAYALLAGLFGTQVHAYTGFGPDDLFIKNTNNKKIGIFWLVGPWTPGNEPSIEAAIGNLTGGVFMAPAGQKIGGTYFHTTPTKELKKKDLEFIMGSKEVTGALFWDDANESNQVIAQFSQFKTGTVKRDGLPYTVQKMEIYLSGGKLAVRKQR